MTTPYGRVTAVLGPTKTGKTHFAIERMLAHQSGMIGLPLRLLAREVYEKIVAVKGAHAVALITGEEKIVPKSPTHWVATVESMPIDIGAEFLAIDEIQLANDAERGHVFTDRLLHARGRSETIFLGSDTMRPLIQKLVPGAQFIGRPRFSDLAYTGARKLTRLPRRSAIVAFSGDAVYSIAELVRRQRGGAAVVMGALSPRTRNAQVALYQSGDVDFIVATDAIGMGLNMDIDHVAFAATEKFDGSVRRPLRANELAQIAGRAGRHMNDGTFGVTAEAEPLDGETIEAIENHRFDPVRVIQWRNTNLDYSTIAALDHSLDVLPPTRGLTRARAADDQLVLRILGAEENIAALAQGPAGVKQLWQACQIPDFRKIATEEHARLVGNVFEHLMSHEGVLPEDWMNGHVARLDNIEGDIDAIAQRIAHVRTWTYVANRPGWLRDGAEWQEKTRAVEDRLSDALHEKLTERFVDRRTSVLMRRLREDEEFVANVDGDGEVLVEGEYVGRLQGFSFVPDPRAVGIHGRALRAAALKGLASEIAARAHALTNAPEAAITLSEHGRLWWNGGIVANLKKGHDPLAPQVELLADDLLSAGARERATERLEEWLAHHITKHLAPLLAVQVELKKELPAKVEAAAPPPAVVVAPAAPDDTAIQTEKDEDSQADAIEAAEAPEPVEKSTSEDAAPAADVPLFASPLQGMARGLAFQIYENLGSVSRQAAARELRAVSQSDRAPLRRLGVRFGAFSIFMPALVKPAAARLKALLWAVHQGMGDVPPPPGAGLTSLPSDPNVPAGFYEAAGFRLCGARAVRIDMLERLGDIIRSKGQSGQMPEAFVPSPDMMSVLGCGEEDLAHVLRGLGFREAREKNEAGEEILKWQLRPRREERRPKARPTRPEPQRNNARPRSSVPSAMPYGQPATEPTKPSVPARSEPSRAERKGPRPDHKPKPKDHGPRRENEGERVRERRPEKKFVVDPDSPFAALAALKFQK
ncbi:MAG: disulfide oxidoreductase [Alphaproteobacteria bacterium]|nr:disulfide oxidoreductase [Alphaproteobacteria bacterium]